MRVGSIDAVNLCDVLLPANREDGPAVRGPDGSLLTVAALRAAVGATAAGLRSAGIQPGDRVAFLAPSTPETVVRYLATLACGAVAILLNPQAPEPELAQELAAVAPRIGPEVFPEPVVGAPLEITPRNDADPALMLFTSGIVGAPRAAILTHGSLRANLEQVAAEPTLRMTPADRALGALPLFHIFGANTALGLALAAGSPITLVDPQDIAGAAHAIARDGITIVASVPTVYGAWLASDLENDTFASIRIAVSGAAALPVLVASVFKDRFGVAIREGYGLTEASPIVSVAAPDDPFGVVGHPLPGVEVRLADPAEPVADVLDGDAGEVWVRGANVFAGYWNDPDATAAALDSEGWLHTGDIAVRTETGALALVDRRKDLIIVSGFNVYPAEVEDVIARDPAVEAVAVLGEPDAKTGETVVAWVVPQAGATVDLEGLRARCRAQLARYKCPTRVTVVDALPRTATGKVLRRALRSM